MPSKPLCKTCHFGEPLNAAQTKCLRFPPMPILLNISRGEKGELTGTETISIHPTNGPTVWCGEYKEREDDAE